MPRLIIISDLHYSEIRSPISQRRSDLSNHLLLKLVERINRFQPADLLILCGDIIDCPESPEDLSIIRDILQKLSIPYIAIPGNHDPTNVYDYFLNPGTRVDILGMRIEIFHDSEIPGYNYHRSDDDLARLRSVRSDGFSGPVIALQHLAHQPDGELYFHFDNQEAIIAAMEEAEVNLTIGGHCHTASEISELNGCNYLSIGALCETPHPYHIVDISDKSIDARIETLAMPYNLIDRHNHTQYAYCSENMQMATSIGLAKTLNLGGLVITEHSAQLYTNEDDFNKQRFLNSSIDELPGENFRMDAYLEELTQYRDDFVHVGMEIDNDLQGGQVIKKNHYDQLDLRVGAVHWQNVDPADESAFAEEFKSIASNLCASGIDILAHPFRSFRRAGIKPDPILFPWLADLLLKNGVAAEINFHTNDPDPEFITICLEKKTLISFGSDAHNLYELGEFFPHLQLMRSIGISGDPTPHLIQKF
ncbi:MAG: metallophosphoesterase family protein [Lentisphaeria bacterium]|nr:metallophosphoesterase [Lentisphaeria bacterium]NQZ66498.1 metallophosphoesterase family protein [Lentisphaeria bacterium]